MHKESGIIKFISLAFTIALLSLIGSTLVYNTKAEWKGAPGLPPIDNVPAPINIGDSNQEKIGGLTLRRDLYIKPAVSDTSKAGLKLFSNSGAGAMYGYLLNDHNTLRYIVDTDQGEQTRLTIGNDGVMAIGDIAIPEAKLHVDGAIKSNGSIQAAGKVYSENKEVLTSFTEQDPKVGSLSSGSWCYSTGGLIVCDKGEPQNRVSSSCASGSSIRVIAQNGTVECEKDDTASTVGLDSVASVHILNNTITSQDLNMTDIETKLQKKISGHCDGRTIVSINTDGTLNCEDDDIGLTSIPLDSIGSEEIKPNSITDADVDINSIQKRVSGVCPVGESIREIRNDGTVDCEKDDSGGAFIDLTVTGNTILGNESTDSVIINGFLESKEFFFVAAFADNEGQGGYPTSPTCSDFGAPGGTKIVTLTEMLSLTYGHQQDGVESAMSSAYAAARRSLGIFSWNWMAPNNLYVGSQSSCTNEGPKDSDGTVIKMCGWQLDGNSTHGSITICKR